MTDQRDLPSRTSRRPGPASRRTAAPDQALVDRESRRIAREELDGNLLVEAGAGSGKTQLLADRMAAGVARGVYRIDRMAAVTFTRKAGSELRGRFHLALEAERARTETLDDETSRAERLARIEEALANLERFFAGTIHSFCARLLRERPVEAGVSPGFTELDEVQDTELRKRVWRDFVAGARNAGDPDMIALLEAGIHPRDLDSGFAIVCLHEDVEFPPGDGVPPDPAPALRGVLAFRKEMQALLDRHVPDGIDPETHCPLQKAIVEFDAWHRVSRSRLERAAVVTRLVEPWTCKSQITMSWWDTRGDEGRALRARIEALHTSFLDAVVEPYLSAWRQYIYRLAVQLLTRARRYAADERRRRNTLNYGDLLILTARVLRENAGVRHALQRKYQHLFVDEFQDTDPVQAEIVFLLAAEEHTSTTAADRSAEPPHPGNELRRSRRSRGARNDTTATLPGLLEEQEPASDDPADWRRAPLRPGALFVVGDPKQSIYRFRRADIDIYNTVRERLAATGRVLPLTTNFRSVPALCEWANRVFRTCFPEEPTRHAPKFAPLNPYVRPQQGPRVPAGALFSIAHGHARYADVIEADAERIATHIRSEVDAGRRQFKDFLVLTRKKKDRIAPYAAALEALDIPVEVSGAGAFGDSPEVAALAALLRALADPQDPVALVAVLRGPLFGISDPELFDYRQSGAWFGIFETEPASTNSAHPVSLSLATLREYYRWTRVLPAAAALERILDASGYLALAATSPGGVEAGDLLHAVDRVRGVVEEGGSLADAADALEDAGAESSEIESLPLEPGRTDVVRVMNLHKAKGLEADVVILADPCGGIANDRVDVHIRREGDRPLGWFKLVKKSEVSYASLLLGEHAEWPQHEAAERPYLDAEENRLLYVAATRAREALVVSRWLGETKRPAWGLLNGFLDEAQELTVPETVAVPESHPADTARELETAFTVRAGAVKESARLPSWSIAAVTSEAKHIARITRAQEEPAEEGDPTQVVRPDTPAHRADAGMAWGTLMHGLLEHAMRYPSATRDDLRRLGLWLTVEEPQLRRSLDDAIETVLRVAKAPFWSEAKAGEHYEEVPFTVALRQEEGGSKEECAFVTGVIDLLYASADGWRVRDYKTDVALDRDAYAEQLKAYREALEAMKLSVADAELVHVRDEKEG